ncbi:4'-phosphopantetheinyl transferase superfamily protein [Streptomyces sp. LARHCF252]
MPLSASTALCATAAAPTCGRAPRTTRRPPPTRGCSPWPDPRCRTAGHGRTDCVTRAPAPPHAGCTLGVRGRRPRASGPGRRHTRGARIPGTAGPSPRGSSWPRPNSPIRTACRTTACEAAVLRCWTRKEAVVKAIGVGITRDLTSPEVHPEDPGPLVVSGAADGGGDRLVEDVPSRNDLFTALAGPVGRTGPAVPRTRESALSRSLLEPFASSRS